MLRRMERRRIGGRSRRARNRVVRIAAAVASLAGLGCASNGYLEVEGSTYHFDFAGFAAAADGRTVLSLSSEIKQSWEVLATTRQVWITLPGEPAEGSCEIGESGCSFRYARNLGLSLGVVCAAQTGARPGACEIPADFGEWARSGSIAIDRFVRDEVLEGRFEVVTASGELSGEFSARFDPLALQRSLE